ncbi:hypothetical protein ACJMK2_034231 [Sinanodonta woodiana]|uniref:Coilin n=1 Tax=Sinanodonta woodiana TaxID=1069815 RepID=A0ABD3WQX3_SINWO
MAAAMCEHVRIKLQFLNVSREPCWMFVHFKEMICIGDVMMKIKEQYLEDKSNLNLYLDGCILPKKESSLILRDNDCVCVRVEENSQENAPKKMKKKKDLKVEQEGKSSFSMLEKDQVSSIICLPHSETEVPLEAAEPSDTLSGNIHAENHRTLKKKKRKMNKDMDDHQEQKKQKKEKYGSFMTPVTSIFSNETIPYSDAVIEPAVDKSVSQSVGKNQDEESDDNQRKKISKTKTTSPITTAIIEKDQDTLEMDGVQQLAVSGKRKRKRHRIRKRRKRENGSGNNNEEHLQNAKNKMLSEQGFVIHDKGNLSEASSSFISNSGSKKHFRFESSGDEEEQQQSNVDGSILITSTVESQMKMTDVSHLPDEENANFVEDDTYIINNEQTEKAQKKKKHSRQNNSQQNPKYNNRDQGGNNFPEIVTNWTNNKNNKSVSELSDSAVSDGNQIQDDTFNTETSALYVSVLPNGVPVFSRQRRTAVSTVSQNKTAVSTVSQNKTAVSTVSQNKTAVSTVSQNKSPQINILGKEASLNGCSQARFGDQRTSQDVTPQRKRWGDGMGQKNWGCGSYQEGVWHLSKQEQLSTQAHNSSVVLVNDVTEHTQAQTSSINPWKNAGCSTANLDADNSEGEESADGDERNLIAIPLGLDVSNCPLLHGPPRVGDRIAYKILEMSSNYTPEISSYKHAEVMNYDPTTGMVTLHNLDQGQEERPLGKFDLILNEDDSDGGITNILGDEVEVQISWSSVIEPRLLKN